MITRTLSSAGIALVLAFGLAAQPRAAEDGVAGAWTLTVKGPAAHGDLTATLVLKQDGKTVDGQFSAHGNEHTLKGTFTDGTLTLESPASQSESSLSLTARLKDDGTLSGYLSSPMGDMAFTGKRD